MMLHMNLPKQEERMKWKRFCLNISIQKSLQSSRPPLRSLTMSSEKGSALDSSLRITDTSSLRLFRWSKAIFLTRKRYIMIKFSLPFFFFYTRKLIQSLVGHHSYSEVFNIWQANPVEVEGKTIFIFR